MATRFMTRRSVTQSSPAAVEVVGNGAVFHHEGLLLARDFVRGPGMELKNAGGKDGSVVFKAQRQGVLFEADGVACNTLGETRMQICLAGARRFVITHLWITNATGAPGAFRAGVYTLPNKGGDVLVAPRAFAGLADDAFSSLRIDLPPASQVVRSNPYLYFAPTVANAAALALDIAVMGEVLKWES